MNFGRRDGPTVVVLDDDRRSLASAVAGVLAAGERDAQGSGNPRWPGKIRNELGGTRVRDWEFRDRKGRR